MPFLDHLEELRWRIIYALIALIIGVGFSFWALTRFDIIGVLQQPILPYLQNGKLVYTHPGDAFSIVLTMSFALGALLAAPVILYQVWAFVAPALYKNERRLIIPVLMGAVGLFVAGVSLAFFVVLPLAVSWLMGFQSASLQPMITASAYFNFAVSMSLAFGLCFELPIVILALAALGIVTPEILNRYRRHALVASVVAGAFLTPGDLFMTTLVMAVPLYFLYEISVALSYGVHRRRLKRQAEQAAEAEADATEAAAEAAQEARA